MTTINIKAYSNCANILLVWEFDELVPDCVGFTIWRAEQNTLEKKTALMSSVGFEDEPHALNGPPKPSTERPFQRCMWNDWTVPRGKKLVYSVETVYTDGVKHDKIESKWSDPVSVGPSEADRKLSAFFNDGVIATQWVAKELHKEGSAGLEHAIKTTDNPVRVHLGGEILRELTARLKEAADSKKTHVYAALFELNDAELEKALADLGPRAHVVLANGSPQKNRTTGEITIDPNAEAREFLRNHHIDLHDRIFETATGGITQHLGHNKFAVFCDGPDIPRFIWTGSTNWTWSGLCTQTNNALLVNDGDVAQRFLDQWRLLAKSGADYPPAGKKLTHVPAPLPVDHAQVTVSFTPYTGKKGTITSTEPADLARATKLIEGAKSGILFLMFIPGPNGTLLEVIQKMNAEKGARDLFVRGVVQQDPGPTAKVPSIALAHRGELLPAPFDIVYPEAVSTEMRWWIRELKKLSHTNAIIHSKVVVVDPMGDHPTVITGSHNLGTKASLLNDENLVIIENHPELAREYAVNIATIFNQYWWRFNRLPAPQKKSSGVQDAEFHAKSNPAPDHLWKGLKHNDQWQHKYLPRGEQRFEIDFWMNRGVHADVTAPEEFEEASTRRKRQHGRRAAHRRPARAWFGRYRGFRTLTAAGHCVH